MQSAAHAHSGTVTLEHQGRLYIGMYHAEGQTMTVSTKLGTRSTKLDETPMDSQARVLLHTMILEGQAETGSVAAG